MIDDGWGEGSAGVNGLVNVSGTEEGSGPEFHQTMLAAVACKWFSPWQSVCEFVL